MLPADCEDHTGTTTLVKAALSVLKCLHLATMKTYLPNAILRMEIHRNKCDDIRDYKFITDTRFVQYILHDEEFLDPQLVFRFFPA